MMMRSFGLTAKDFFSNRLTEVVLPTPVEPKTENDAESVCGLRLKACKRRRLRGF
jgi:hypothetical protein